MPEDKSKKRSDCRSNSKHQNGNKNESQKQNNNNEGEGNCAKKNEVEATSRTPQTRKMKGTKKALEAMDPDGKKIV